MAKETLENIIEDMQFCVDAQRRSFQTGGVPYHGPLCNAAPSVLKDMERWVARLNELSFCQNEAHEQCDGSGEECMDWDHGTLVREYEKLRKELERRDLAWSDALNQTPGSPTEVAEHVRNVLALKDLEIASTGSMLLSVQQECILLKAMLAPLKASAEWHHESNHSEEAIDNCRHPACIALSRLGEW